MEKLVTVSDTLALLVESCITQHSVLVGVHASGHGEKIDESFGGKDVLEELRVDAFATESLQYRSSAPEDVVRPKSVEPQNADDRVLGDGVDLLVATG